jgi:hypothetical protein
MLFSGRVAVLLLPLLPLVSLVNSIPAPSESPESGQSCANVTDTVSELFRFSPDSQSGKTHLLTSRPRTV